MPIPPVLTKSFADPDLVAIVLGSNGMAQRGFIWGEGGGFHYCFVNPAKWSFVVWKKEFYLRRLGYLLIPGFNVLFGVGSAAHYCNYIKTAKDQSDACVITNGPQMRMPFNLDFFWTAVIVVAAGIAPMIIGLIWGGPGVVVGAFVGLNLLPLTMAVLGFFTTPFNAVLAATFSDAGAHYAGYMHIVQAAGAHSMNFDDPASAEGSGGLSPFIFQRVTGNRLAPPRNHAYNQMSQRGVPFVVWGLIPIDYAQNPLLREAVQSQSYEQGEEPTVLIVVAGKPGGWTHQDTNILLNHGVSDACATDGSGSCLMGSPGNLVMEPWWYTDKVQRYGFKMVPRAP